MKTVVVSVMALFLAASVLWAQDAPNAAEASTDSAASQPAVTPLPDGHPPIGGMPEGHPPMGEMPPGHPPMGQMPAGHPPIDGMSGGQAPTMSKEPYTISLAIQAVQGTADGAPVAGDAVTVVIHNGHEPLKTIETTLDEHGVVMVEGIEVEQPTQPIVTVTHAGVPFEAVGEVLSAQQPQQHIDVPVYEVTDQQPQWVVRMRHVMVEAIPGGLSVNEVVVVENPGDRAWLGTQTEDGMRQAMSVMLPHDLEKVQLISGFEQSTASLSHGRLSDGSPLLPGMTQYRFAYGVPQMGGQVVVSLAAPVPTDRLMVLLPDDGGKVMAQGLEGGGTVNMGDRPSRMYKAEGIAPDAAVGFVMQSMGDAPAQGAPGGPGAAPMSGSTPPSESNAKTLVGIGGGAAVLVIVVLLLIKSPKKAAEKS